MIEKFRMVIGQIDADMVRRWVTDLVISKTFTGFRFQEAILRECAARRGAAFRPATVQDEARGIDGYIGTAPISVKPTTYRKMGSLGESIPVVIVYYDKTKAGLSVDDSLLQVPNPKGS